MCVFDLVTKLVTSGLCSASGSTKAMKKWCSSTIYILIWALTSHSVIKVSETGADDPGVSPADLGVNLSLFAAQTASTRYPRSMSKPCWPATRLSTWQRHTPYSNSTAISAFRHACSVIVKLHRVVVVWGVSGNESLSWFAGRLIRSTPPHPEAWLPLKHRRAGRNPSYLCLNYS